MGPAKKTICGAAFIINASLSLVGSGILAGLVPWAEVFRPTTLCGGDNPAHPVLMQTLRQAFFSHGELIHYCTRFWGGFEAFQFYFILPYLSGAVLARWMHPGVAFKLVTLFGILGLPCAFYWMASFLGFSRMGRVMSSLLSFSFLFTQAHVMWGGNILSDLAGMIGNAWGFVFFVLAFGAILGAHERRIFSFSALAFCVLAALSHFYALVMLGVLWICLGLYDGIEWVRTRQSPPWRTYLIGVFLLGGVAWWVVPLIHYAPFSSDLGGDWNIHLLDTFTRPEKIAFILSLSIGLGVLFQARGRHRTYAIGFLFLGIYLLMFFFNRLFNSSVLAFVDVRLWPSIYFAAYFLLIVTVETVWRRLPHAYFPLVLCASYFLIPLDSSFTKAREWMHWNYQGIESSRGWNELRRALDGIRDEPPARISYEAYGDYVNAVVGSVRAMELIPYLTHHEIILGGIVNSASFAGIGYFLQCLMSDEGAGWPAGSVMPAKDIARGINMMQALGIRYHIAFRPGNRAILDKTPGVQKIFDGQYLAMYQLTQKVHRVEVFSGPLPWFASKEYKTALLNFPRWDVLRDGGIIFRPFQRGAAGETGPGLTIESLVNFLLLEWNAGRRVRDMGWQDRIDRVKNRLNLFLYFRGGRFRPDQIGRAEFFIADRGFDPDLFALKGQARYSELAAPLMRTVPGRSLIRINGAGYRIFSGDRELPIGADSEIDLEQTSVDGVMAPFTWLVFKPIGQQHYVELSTSDPQLHSGFPTAEIPPFPARITEACAPDLEVGFERIVLHTHCPGKPHLIKYSYYPKWQAEVPIAIGTNGFMVLTPEHETTVLTHRPGWADRVGEGITLLGVLLLAWYGRFEHKRRRGFAP